MKSEKGITLGSLVTYIVLLFIVFGILATIRANLQSNIHDINSQGTENYEIDKFNMYFLQEVKKQGNGISSISNNGKEISFLTGNKYIFEDNSIKIIDKDNNTIIIANDIENCVFEKISEDGKTIINVTIKTEDGEVKNKQYVLNDENLETTYVDEEKYTSVKDEELPAEYQEVEYLESDGRQYIDTKIRANSDDSLYIECMPTNNGPSTQQMVYGGRNGSSSNNQVMGCLDVENTWSYFSWGSNYNISTLSPNLGIKYTIKIENKSLFINDISYKTYESDFSGDSDIYLFNLNGDTQNRPFVGRIYYFRISNKINLVPYVRKSDNRPGMYDLVNGVFYTNQGSGEFTVGPDVN